MTIETLQAPTYPALSGLARLAGLVSARIVEVFHAYKNRRAMAELGALDERMLRDVGLTRGDLRDAVSEPLWRDPSLLLVKRAAERRVTRGPVSVVPPGFVPSPPSVPAQDTGDRLFPARSRYY